VLSRILTDGPSFIVGSTSSRLPGSHCSSCTLRFFFLSLSNVNPFNSRPLLPSLPCLVRKAGSNLLLPSLDRLSRPALLGHALRSLGGRRSHPKFAPLQHREAAWRGRSQVAQDPRLGTSRSRQGDVRVSGGLVDQVHQPDPCHCSRPHQRKFASPFLSLIQSLFDL
jgi:hypothetical protein